MFGNIFGNVCERMAGLHEELANSIRERHNLKALVESYKEGWRTRNEKIADLKSLNDVLTEENKNYCKVIERMSKLDSPYIPHQFRSCLKKKEWRSEMPFHVWKPSTCKYYHTCYYPHRGTCDGTAHAVKHCDILRTVGDRTSHEDVKPVKPCNDCSLALICKNSCYEEKK